MPSITKKKTTKIVITRTSIGAKFKESKGQERRRVKARMAILERKAGANLKYNILGGRGKRGSLVRHNLLLSR